MTPCFLSLVRGSAPVAQRADAWDKKVLPATRRHKKVLLNGRDSSADFLSKTSDNIFAILLVLEFQSNLASAANIDRSFDLFDIWSPTQDGVLSCRNGRPNSRSMVLGRPKIELSLTVYLRVETGNREEIVVCKSGSLAVESVLDRGLVADE